LVILPWEFVENKENLHFHPIVLLGAAGFFANCSCYLLERYCFKNWSMAVCSPFPYVSTIGYQKKFQKKLSLLIYFMFLCGIDSFLFP